MLDKAAQFKFPTVHTNLTNAFVGCIDIFYLDIPVQYLIPKKPSGLTRELTEKLYEKFSDDLITKDVSKFRQEIDRWVVKWDIASDPNRLI
jgi:hypothetical protein